MYEQRSENVKRRFIMPKAKLLTEVAESVGKFIEYWGFRSIHGRVWALIYLSDRSISTPEIIEQLGVSKSLVSTAINELIEYGLISADIKVTFGAQTYLAVDDVAQVVRKILRERELTLLSQAESNMKLLSAYSSEELLESNVNLDKLNALIDLNASSKGLLTKFVSKKVNSIKDWTGLLKKASKMWVL